MYWLFCKMVHLYQNPQVSLYTYTYINITIKVEYNGKCTIHLSFHWGFKPSSFDHKLLNWFPFSSDLNLICIYNYLQSLGHKLLSHFVLPVKYTYASFCYSNIQCRISPINLSSPPLKRLIYMYISWSLSVEFQLILYISVIIKTLSLKIMQFQLFHTTLAK